MARISRRKFVKKAVQSGAAVSFAVGALSCSSSTKEQGLENGSLNILILGGTSFLGPHQIASALSRGHSVTTFTRGRTLPTVHQDLFDNVTSLVGDRANDLSALETGTWDVVIDNSGHNVEWAKATASLLKDRADLYVFTSSTGVYYPYLGNDIDENTEPLLAEPEGIEDEEMKIEYWYGVMKANSENVVKEHFGEDRSLIIRPTYMIGPGDKSNRFIHWPVRLARGGDILVPGKPDDPVQYADVRDIAEWMIRMVEQKASGTYNGVGPVGPTGMMDFVEKAGEVFDVEKNFVIIDDYEFLKSQHIHHMVPWIMPEGNNYGSARIDNSRGITAGLTFRPLPETVRDTYNWWYSDALSDEIRAEFEDDPENVLNKEREIIETWRS